MHRVLPDSGAAPASTRVRGCTQPHEQSCGACLERFFEPLTAAAAPAPDMATAEMIAHSTARPPQKHRRSDMRDARHAEAARPTPTMVNRRAPDKTHPRQPTSEHHGGRARAEWRHGRATPPRAAMTAFCPGAPAAHRATAPRAHPPPWASSPGRCRGAHAVAANRRRA